MESSSVSTNDEVLLLPYDREPLCLLSDEELTYLRSTYEKVPSPRGSVLYRENDPADAVYFILDGKVKIFKEGAGGRDQIVKFAGPLDVIGYRAVLAHEAHSASASVVDDAILAKVPAPVLGNLMMSNIKVAIYIVRMLARELKFSRVQSVSLTQKQTRGRLAESLLILRNKFGLVEGTSRINCKIKREDLASLSNMTTASAIRTLSAFAEEGLVMIDGRDISILDEVGLANISRLG